MVNTEAEPKTEAGPLAGEIVRAGAIAGLIGGVLMAIWSMLYAVVAGMGLWMPLKMIGATFYGVSALVGGPGVLAYGLTLHVAVSIAYGILFASIVSRYAPPGRALLAGIAYGVAILVFMTFVVLPLFNTTMRERVPTMSASWIIDHILFGIGVSTAPLLRRAFHRPHVVPAQASPPAPSTPA